MTMKTSYRKIYLFLLLLTSYSCNDLTETNMSIDIISMTKYNNIIRQRLGENTGGITQVTGVEFILFAPFITVVMLCFLLVSVSAILYSILKVKSLMIPF